MDDLMRDLAPISDEAWGEIEDEARQTIKASLAARKIVDFTGPVGWARCAVDTGRYDTLRKPPRKGVEARLRVPQPLVEFRIPFTLSRRELEQVTRGASDPDLDPVRQAARTIALAEDAAVFHGYGEGRIEGMFEAAKDQALTLTDDYEKYPAVVAQAMHTIAQNGVAGPYAVALGPRCYTGLTRTTTGAGYPVIEHVREIVDGPILAAPGIDGAAVVSLRGGDFELTVGRDFSIGYLAHDRDTVELYIEESFTFRPHGPEAVVPLRYADKKK